MNALGPTASFTNPPRPSQKALTWTLNNYGSSELVHLIRTRLPSMTGSQVEALYNALAPIGSPFSLGDKAIEEWDTGIERKCNRCKYQYYKLNNTRVACRNEQRHISDPMALSEEELNALVNAIGAASNQAEDMSATITALNTLQA